MIFMEIKICHYLPVNKKVITPNVKECEINSRARSAKLRIAEKV